jgi:hypothetical protein
VSDQYLVLLRLQSLELGHELLRHIDVPFLTWGLGQMKRLGEVVSGSSYIADCSELSVTLLSLKSNLSRKLNAT